MSEEKAPTPDALLAQALGGLSSNAQVRLVGWRLCARLLADTPKLALLRSLRDEGAVASLAQLAAQSLSAAAGPLEALAQWLETADDEALQTARRDFDALFLAAKHLPAPPWESVYTSPERLVHQEAARDVLHAYAEAGFIFDGWKDTPADHVSLELDFAATLLAESARSEVAAQRLARFEKAHLGVWVPRFCADLEKAAKSPLYQLLARALPALLPVPVGA